MSHHCPEKVIDAVGKWDCVGCGTGSIVASSKILVDGTTICDVSISSLIENLFGLILMRTNIGYVTYRSTPVASTRGMAFIFDMSGSAALVSVTWFRQMPVAVAVAMHLCLAKLIMMAVEVEKVDKPGGILDGNIGNWCCKSCGYVMNISSAVIREVEAS